MQPIVIDTDMGVDDALAIMLALNSPEVELMGLTTVAGNVPLEQGTRNALQVLELQGRDDIPVYMGGSNAVGAYAGRCPDRTWLTGFGRS
ncbi:MAG: nucleoside hydrolase [Candidatus Latescibacterota bacterium]|jgi:purine nucleosidase